MMLLFQFISCLMSFYQLQYAVQDLYYYGQLTINTFGIHDINTEKLNYKCFVMFIVKGRVDNANTLNNITRNTQSLQNN